MLTAFVKHLTENIIQNMHIYFQALVIRGTSYSVSEFQSTILSSPKLKETFQQTLSSQFSADTLKSFAGSICTQVSNFNSSSIFSTPTNFEILLTLNGDCILSDSQAETGCNVFVAAYRQLEPR